MCAVVVVRRLRAFRHGEKAELERCLLVHIHTSDGVHGWVEGEDSIIEVAGLVTFIFQYARQRGCPRASSLWYAVEAELLVPTTGNEIARWIKRNVVNYCAALELATDFARRRSDEAHLDASALSKLNSWRLLKLIKIK